MAANAALLDELMGAHRNALPGEREADEVEWKGNDVRRILGNTLECNNTALTTRRFNPLSVHPALFSAHPGL